MFVFDLSLVHTREKNHAISYKTEFFQEKIVCFFSKKVRNFLSRVDEALVTGIVEFCTILQSILALKN